MTKVETFDSDKAKIWGVNPAILLSKFEAWTEYQRINGIGIKDDLVWVVNSKESFNQLFPYLTLTQIGTALTTLITNGLLLKRTENTEQRIFSYALTNEYFEQKTKITIIKPEVKRKNYIELKNQYLEDNKEYFDKLFTERPKLKPKLTEWLDYKATKHKEVYSGIWWINKPIKDGFTDDEIVDSVDLAITNAHQGIYPKKTKGGFAKEVTQVKPSETLKLNEDELKNLRRI